MRIKGNNPVLLTFATLKFASGPKILKYVAITFIWVVSLAVLLELIYRVWLFGMSAFNYNYVNSWISANSAKISILQAGLPRYIYEPKLKTYFKGARLVTNSLGMADDREYESIRAPGTFRIAVIGDSHSVPSGIEVKNSYHRVLETNIQALTSRSVEILNFAVGGYFLDDKLARYSSVLGSYHPDLVLFQWSLPRDLTVNPNFRLTRLPNRDPFFESFLLRYFRSPFGIGRVDPGIDRTLLGYNQSLAEEFLKDNRPDNPSKQPILHVIVSHMVLVKDSEEVKQGLIERFRKHDALFVDLNDEFDRLYPMNQRRKFWISKIDSHPNEFVHKEWARIITHEMVNDPRITKDMIR